MFNQLGPGRQPLSIGVLTCQGTGAARTTTPLKSSQACSSGPSILSGFSVKLQPQARYRCARNNSQGRSPGPTHVGQGGAGAKPRINTYAVIDSSASSSYKPDRTLDILERGTRPTRTISSSPRSQAGCCRGWNMYARTSKPPLVLHPLPDARSIPPWD